MNERPPPEQPLGPYYPGALLIDSNVDLTCLKDSSTRAKGEIVFIEGVVTDECRRPIEGATVEVWQACQGGRYDHPSEPSSTPRDPNFRYYGTMKTNAKGEYSFKTIKPGSYLASVHWRRPPHIHYKVSFAGHRELITQLYFKGDELNQNDEILSKLSHGEQKEIILPFQKVIEDGKPALKGKFNLTLQKT